MVSEISPLPALLAVELHPVDGDDTDEILGSFCAIANSSTGLVVYLVISYVAAQPSCTRHP